MLDRLRFRIRALFQRGAVEHEMQAEMAMHLDQRVKVLVARGMTPEDARIMARREFGNVAVLQEEARDARGTQWLDALAGDVRFALRHFARRRLTTMTIVVILALGIAAHAFELSIIRAWSTRPPQGISASLPLARVRGLFRAADQPEWRSRWMSYAEVREFAAAGVFSSVAASNDRRVVVQLKGAAEVSVVTHFVNDDYFRTIGVAIAKGPGLPRGGAGAGADLVAVVSHRMWERELGGLDVIGTTMVVNGLRVRITGIAPPAFSGMLGTDNPTDGNADPGPLLWMPLGARPIILSTNGATAFALESPDSLLFEVVGRLRDGVSTDDATAAVRLASARAKPYASRVAAAGSPKALYDADAVYLRGVTSLESDMPILIGLVGMLTTLLLLVVCTNVAGLIVSSGAARGQEIAIRVSLGASRGRIIRQLLTESCVLSLMGGALGVSLLWAGLRIGQSSPTAQYFAPDLVTVAITMFVALGAGMLFGLTPAFHATRADVRPTLNASGAGATPRSRMQRIFVTAQITLTQPLLVVVGALAAMMLMMEQKALAKDVPEHVLQFRVQGYAIPGSGDDRAAALERMERRIRSIPGVVKILPAPEKRPNVTLALPEADRRAGPESARQVKVDRQIVHTGFFNLLDVPLLRGDDLVPADSAATLVIGTDLARALFGDSDPVGRRIEAIGPNVAGPRVYTVTGVYDSRFIGDDDSPTVYRPVRNWWPNEYQVRTAVPATELAPTIRQAIRAELPTVPIESWATVAELVAKRNSGAPAIMTMIFGSAALVLFIACIGLYGVVALAVVQRQREIGIRMALGARAREVVALFYRSGMRLSVLGLALGLPLSLIAVRVLNAKIQELDARQPSLILLGLVIGVVVLGVASAATLLPARRAATVDPISVLRSE
jgi:putative ABC transport system permease protein